MDEAARAAQPGRAVGQAKSRTKTKTLNQIRHLGFTAPDPIRQRLSGLTAVQVAVSAASLRPRAGDDPVTFATKSSLRILGRRVLALDAELAELNVPVTG